MKRPKRRRCQNCKKALPRQTRGRPAIYCSASCRQRAYERRRIEEIVGLIAARAVPAHLLNRDIDTIRNLDNIEKAVVRVLEKYGLIPSSPKRPPPLKLVHSDDPPDGEGA